MNELNKKLAEWAGFKGVFWTGAHLVGQQDDRGNEWELVEFTQSLDACFAELVPKAIEIIKARHSVGVGDFGAHVILFGRWLDEGFDALALCKAIEKLIDGEAK